MLRLRIPQILDRPSLLAHTIYQTIVFDDSIRQGGFSLANTVAGRTGESAKDGTSTEWQGLTSVILREAGWYEHWVKGEKQCKFPFLPSHPAYRVQSICRG